MSKLDAKEVADRPVGRERVQEARLQAGGVHWGGARPITHLTTDKTKTSSIGSHIVVADELSLHPAGIMINIGSETFIIPHSRIEYYKLA
jgi:hypothetical protein